MAWDYMAQINKARKNKAPSSMKRNSAPGSPSSSSRILGARPNTASVNLINCTVFFCSE